MSTRPSASRVQLNLPRFDGFPYLITRVVSCLYHIIVIPARQRAEWYQDLLHRQGEANRLETSLVLDARTAWFWSPDGDLAPTSQPPTGGVIVTDRLQPCEAFDRTPDLLARHTRLTRFSEARKVGGYLHGDLNKGGRTATREECHRLAGVDADGVPNGLEQCGDCGDWHGKCLDPSPNFTTWLVQVHCRCGNHNRCASCGLPLDERRLNANYSRESDGHIWHVPGFCGLSHRCPGAREHPTLEDLDAGIVIDSLREPVGSGNASDRQTQQEPSSRTRTEPVRVDVDRLLQTATAKRNLAPAFVAAIEVRRDLITELADAGALEDKYGLWEDEGYAENDYYEGWGPDVEGLRYPPDEDVFRLIDRSPEPLLAFFCWESRVSSVLTYSLVRDIGGYDVLYSDGEGEGYPILMTRLTGEPGLDEAVTGAICSEAPLWGPGTITNWRPDLVHGDKIYRALEDASRDGNATFSFGELPEYWKESYAEECVGREEASSIAGRYCKEHGWAGIAGIKDVGEEPAPFFHGNPLRQCWVVWPRDKPRQRKRNIILVSKMNGQILYAGPVRPGELPADLVL